MCGFHSFLFDEGSFPLLFTCFISSARSLCSALVLDPVVSNLNLEAPGTGLLSPMKCVLSLSLRLP